MKIKSFKATNVRGYLNFDIPFHEDLNFLIGINGSGKTTVLKLLSGMLSPSLEYLLDIEFGVIRVECDLDGGRIVLLSCEKDDKTFTLAIGPTEHEDTKEAKWSPTEYYVEYNRTEYSRRKSDLLDAMKSEFRNSDYYDEFIGNLKSPLILGLSRRVTRSDIEELAFPFRGREELITDSVDLALKEMQEKVYQFVRKEMNQIERNTERFKNQILDDVFDFGFHGQTISLEDLDLEKLKNREGALKDALIALDRGNLIPNMELFFTQLKESLAYFEEHSKKQTQEAETNEEDDDARFNHVTRWIIGQSQMDKFDKIAEHAKTYRSDMSKISESRNRFKDSVNMFLKEGGKEMFFLSSGEIRFRIGDRKLSLYELSSGEKQLVVILGHLSLLNNKNKSSVFIVDEPELSLHLTWQEQFVEALQTANPKVQYILATHAPAIVADVNKRDKCIDLTQLR